MEAQEVQHQRSELVYKVEAAALARFIIPQLIGSQELVELVVMQEDQVLLLVSVEVENLAH